MTRSEISLTLATMSAYLCRRNFNDLANLYEFPLPFYANDEFYLVPSKSHFVRGLQKTAEVMTEQGVVRLDARLLEIEDRTPERALAIAEWRHLNASDEVLSRNTARYVMCRNEVAGRPTIELVEYLALNHPTTLGDLLTLNS